MKNARLTTEDCEMELYCGLPYLLPVRHFIWKTHWIPGPAPNDPIPTTFEYNSTHLSNNVVRYSIKATGKPITFSGIKLFSCRGMVGEPKRVFQ